MLRSATGRVAATHREVAPMIERVLAVVDADGSGAVELSELCAYASNVFAGAIHDPGLCRLFSAFGVAGDAASLERLRALCGTVGAGASDRLTRDEFFALLVVFSAEDEAERARAQLSSGFRAGLGLGVAVAAAGATLAWFAFQAVQQRR